MHDNEAQQVAHLTKIVKHWGLGGDRLSVVHFTMTVDRQTSCGAGATFVASFTKFSLSYASLCSFSELSSCTDGAW